MVHELRLDRRSVPHHLLDEPDLVAVAAEHLVDSHAGVVGAQPGRHPAVHPELRVRGDHVDLLRRVDHGGRQSHAQGRLEEHGDTRVARLDLRERSVEVMANGQKGVTSGAPHLVTVGADGGNLRELELPTARNQPARIGHVLDWR